MSNLLPVDRKAPLRIGVLGGSFNPPHLGHVLLAISTQQTKNLDSVVVVPVFKHAVKRNLLPFEDRVNMCNHAFASSKNIVVSRIEEEVGASNGAMLIGLKAKYPPGSLFFWICGDDFFRWMERPKGLETLSHVQGIIVQRRLHRKQDGGLFQEPVDEPQLQATATSLNLQLDFIYGELPHFSSTLVRQAPGTWRNFLPTSVAEYLDARPRLQEQLLASLDQAKESGPSKAKHKVPASFQLASSWVLKGLELLHCLQYERGRTGMRIATGTPESELELNNAQRQTNVTIVSLMSGLDTSVLDQGEWPETYSLIEDLRHVDVWLRRDRTIQSTQKDKLSQMSGTEGWAARLAITSKFDSRLDVILSSIIRSLVEIRQNLANFQTQPSPSRKVPQLLELWCRAKEALGRLRALVTCGGHEAPELVKSSWATRQKVVEAITYKDQCIKRVLDLQNSVAKQLAAPEALFRMLGQVASSERSVLGNFCASTPLHVIHEQLSSETGSNFSVDLFFHASSAAIDFLLTFCKALAASGCSTL